MKKLTLFVCIAVAMVVVVSGCKKATSNPYSGTYVGTLSSLVGNINKEDVKMLFTNGLADETNLYLYGLPLVKLTPEKYEAKGELVVKIIQLITPEMTFEELKDADFIFVFSEGKVRMDAKYEVLGGLVTANVMTYQGTKQ